MRLFFTLLSISWASMVSAQTSGSNSIYYKNDTIEFDLPIEYKSSHEHYVEGDYYMYFKPDSTLLVVHIGSMVTLPHLRGLGYVVTDSIYNDRRGINSSDQRLWREINLSKSNLYYDHVKNKDIMFLDSLLDSIAEKLKNSR